MENLFTTVSPAGSILMQLGVPYAVAMPATVAGVGLVFAFGVVLYRRLARRS